MRRGILLLLLSVLIISGTIDLDNLSDYANQTIPNYITKDNTPNNNQITDLGATLGRVLFYDKKLSVNNTIACGSCHIQAYAFGDTAVASVGVNGTTGRHSMRLVNARFAEEGAAFWDERAASYEIQATQPIQDHAEMGFSATNGDPDFDSLIRKMEDIPYYPRLFDTVFGDSAITEARMQLAIAQFVRSIQSYDSKFDVGRANAPNNNVPFNNFTADENTGKGLFLTAPQTDNMGNRIGGGLGCGGCHRAPEFDIDPNSGHNGVTGSIGGGTDNTNTKSPSLRDILDANGNLNGQMMHNGAFSTIDQVIDHYNNGITLSQGLDPRLGMMGNPQNLQITATERTQLIAFLQTLTGSDIYSNPKWSDPFTDGDLTILPEITTPVDTTDTMNTSIANVHESVPLRLFPNPAVSTVNLEGYENYANEQFHIFSVTGKLVQQGRVTPTFDVSPLPSGMYILVVGKERLRFTKH